MRGVRTELQAEIDDIRTELQAEFKRVQTQGAPQGLRAEPRADRPARAGSRPTSGAGRRRAAEGLDLMARPSRAEDRATVQGRAQPRAAEGLDLMARPSRAEDRATVQGRAQPRAAEGLDLMARPSRAEDRRAGPASGPVQPAGAAEGRAGLRGPKVGGAATGPAGPCSGRTSAARRPTSTSGPRAHLGPPGAGLNLGPGLRGLKAGPPRGLMATRSRLTSGPSRAGLTAHLGAVQGRAHRRAVEGLELMARPSRAEDRATSGRSSRAQSRAAEGLMATAHGPPRAVQGRGGPSRAEDRADRPARAGLTIGPPRAELMARGHRRGPGPDGPRGSGPGRPGPPV